MTCLNIYLVSRKNDEKKTRKEVEVWKRKELTMIKVKFQEKKNQLNFSSVYLNIFSSKHQCDIQWNDGESVCQLHKI